MIEKVYRVYACEQVGYANSLEEAVEMEKRFKRNYGSCSCFVNGDGSVEFHSVNALGEEDHYVSNKTKLD